MIANAEDGFRIFSKSLMRALQSYVPVSDFLVLGLNFFLFIFSLGHKVTVGTSNTRWQRIS